LKYKPGVITNIFLGCCS